MNGYLQITLNGRKQGLKFGNMALLTYSQLNGTAPGEIQKQNYFKLIADLVFCGLMNNYFIKDLEPDFTQEDVRGWVDDMPIDEMTLVVETFTKTMETSPALKKLMDAQELQAEPGKEGEAVKKSGRRGPGRKL